MVDLKAPERQASSLSLTGYVVGLKASEQTGWKPSYSFSGEILQQFMEATDPEGVGNDPDYTRGHTGKDRVRYRITLPEGVDAARATVRARMYYQAFQPFWLKRKFDLSGHDPATQRLYYLASHLNTAGTVIDQWKLPLAQAEAKATANPGE